jgi:hypothetical protein
MSVVPEFDDPRVAVERGLHDAALHAAAAAVHEPDLFEARVSGSGHVFVDDRGNVGWRKSVEVDLALDRDMVHKKLTTEHTERTGDLKLTFLSVVRCGESVTADQAFETSR